jgi:iron complex outermembrane receptor protein
VRSLDAFALWNFSRTLSVRLGVNNIAPLDSATRTSFNSGDSTRTTREGRAFYSANLEMKL